VKKPLLAPFFAALLIFTPLALLAAVYHASPLLVFLLSAIAIIPLAKYIGDATAELASHTNAGFGGFLNATFGNATELIVGVFALHAGLLGVVKASIIGSVLGNVLLVLGTAILAGGWKREHQKFNATAAKAGCSMLLLATIALVVPALFKDTSPQAPHITIMSLSIVVAVLMIFGYLAQLLFSLRTHKHLYRSSEEQEILVEHRPANSVTKNILILAAATIAIAFVSDTLVGSITPLVTNFGWTQLFIGVIVVAIVGNAAEHVSAIQAALRNQMDLAIGITIGSATQIVMFVAPVLVLLSLVLGHPMDLVFNLFELVAFIFAVFVTNAIIEDGETNWLEGVQLLLAYGILAVAFFLHA
jgi:Ca2+:H+ antiporter